MSFGENLISLRKQMGWSQDDLANNLNLSRQAISKWENDTSKPDIDNVKKISKIFSVTIDDLLNNEVPKEKAVALDVKKEEKKERTITIVKLMIIAVIVLYVISVIYKFASLLIIVNGVQKYANLSNYHYVITTYDENGLAEKEECWFKDGVSKTENKIYEQNSEISKVTNYIDYNNNLGYISNDDGEETQINVNEYLNVHINYEKGYQLYSKLPQDLKKTSFIETIERSLFDFDLSLKRNDQKIIIFTKTSFTILEEDSLLPVSTLIYDNNNEQFLNIYYSIEIGGVESI